MQSIFFFTSWVVWHFVSFHKLPDSLIILRSTKYNLISLFYKISSLVKNIQINEWLIIKCFAG